MYPEIQRTVRPKVEFHQGIPQDLDDDEYFDVKINNLLILDDLYSTSSKDRRITDLYTEGSHHRSLSVVSISQSLYASKDPTQRRNCHYLVLFKNPVDKSSIMTLARQMYPQNTEHFTKAFEKSTKYPYGFLLVDLKRFTPDQERLKYNVVWPESTQQIADGKRKWYQPADHVTTQKSIKREESCEVFHSGTDQPSVKIESHSNSERNYYSANDELENTNNKMADKGHACDDCGLLFDTSHDVQRHLKQGWCAEKSEPPAKRRKTEESVKPNITSEENIEDNEGFLSLWKRVKSDCNGKFDKIYQQYIDDGEEEEDAREMTEDKIKPFEERKFLQIYGMLLENYWLPLLNNDTHTKIIESIRLLIRKGMSPSSAIRRVLYKNKASFEDLFDTTVSDDENTDDEESEEESTNENDSDEE